MDAGFYNSANNSAPVVVAVPTVAHYALVPDGVDPTSYISNFYAPIATQDYSWDAGNNYNYDNDTVYYPQYVWVDLGSVAALFTTGSDTVNFKG